MKFNKLFFGLIFCNLLTLGLFSQNQEDLQQAPLTRHIANNPAGRVYSRAELWAVNARMLLQNQGQIPAPEGLPSLDLFVPPAE